MIEKNNNNNGKIIIAFAVVVAVFTLTIGIIYIVKVESIETEASSTLGVITKDGENFVLETNNPITLTIITDKTCEACGTEKIEAIVKKQIGTSIAVQRLDYSSDKGKELFDRYEGAYFPLFLLGNEIESVNNYTHLTHHVITKVQDRYLVDLEKIGTDIGKYVGVESYKKNDPKAPSIFISESTYDFGEVKLSDDKISTSFSVKNKGENTLVFLGLNTSCGCTSAKVVTPSGESPEYLMAGHGEPVKWNGELAPGEEGEIVIFYDPTVHPDLNGDVTRSIEIKTNDPNNPKKTLKIFVKQSPN